MSSGIGILPSTLPGDRLERQMRFLLEVDRLKGILRQTRVLGGERRENSAEHSWHLALCALALAEHAPAGTDPVRAVLMTLLHDVVEIDAGDAFAYDAAANVGKEEREQAAAARVFGLLPPEQAAELTGLWEEFEEGETPTARFAVAMDRVQPVLLNFASEGGSWKQHAVTYEQVMIRMAPIERGAPAVWPWLLRLLDEALVRGYLPPKSTA
ncbi:MAG TPA: HD domain-containing protein [Longimicrobium sp.]|uniref:HD domain-containing protein n=1 Tax=Longimicrobium sp. TaxID=2029185 RepID=UPI002EDB9D3E